MNARLLRPGGLVYAIDLILSQRADTLDVFDIVAAEDRTQAADPVNRAKRPHVGPLDLDLRILANGAAADLMDAGLLLVPVLGLRTSDLAITAEAYASTGNAWLGASLRR